jgi:hypothetical protein
MTAKKARALLEKIQAHFATVESLGLEGPREYVGSMFPATRDAIFDTRVFENTNTAFLRRVDLYGAGGVYIRKIGVVLICYSPGFPSDVVAVHELLHAASALLGSSGDNERQEEDFAYTKSVPYLLDAGHSVDWIIRKYMWPYYISVTRAEVAQRSDKDRFSQSDIDDLCYEKCHDLAFPQYADPDADDDEEDDRFDFL